MKKKVNYSYPPPKIKNNNNQQTHNKPWEKAKIVQNPCPLLVDAGISSSWTPLTWREHRSILQVGKSKLLSVFLFWEDVFKCNNYHYCNYYYYCHCPQIEPAFLLGRCASSPVASKSCLFSTDLSGSCGVLVIDGPNLHILRSTSQEFVSWISHRNFQRYNNNMSHTNTHTLNTKIWTKWVLGAILLIQATYFSDRHAPFFLDLNWEWGGGGGSVKLNGTVPLWC